MLIGVTVMTALADDTRRQIVEVLAERDCTVNELVDRFTVSQPAISRHLRLLREADVVTVAPQGKHRIYRLNPTALDEVGAWASQCRSRWEARFDALGDHLDHLAAQRRKAR